MALFASMSKDYTHAQYTGAVALFRATFGQGSGQIWLDNVECTGSEVRLIDCPANPIGTHNCAHSEDAGVRCSTISTCEENHAKMRMILILFCRYHAGRCPTCWWDSIHRRKSGIL